MEGRRYGQGYGRVSQMSESAFMRAMALFTLVEGLLVTIGARMSYNSPASWILLLLPFGISLVCIWIFESSKSPMVSGIGVAGMSLALGLMIGPFVKLYDVNIVLEAVVLTGAVMVVMSLLGMAFPSFFLGIGSFLIAGLVFLIVFGFGQIFLVAIGIHQANSSGLNTLMAWAGIAIFSGLVAYDWVKALDGERTLDNAIDASGGLILDAVNLFLRILEILGKSKK